MYVNLTHPTLLPILILQFNLLHRTRSFLSLPCPPWIGSERRSSQLGSLRILGFLLGFVFGGREENEWDGMRRGGRDV